MDKKGFAEEIFKGAKGELTRDQATRIADRTVNEMEVEAAKSPNRSINQDRFKKILEDNVGNVIVERYAAIIAKAMITDPSKLPQEPKNTTPEPEGTKNQFPYRIPALWSIDNRNRRR